MSRRYGACGPTPATCRTSEPTERAVQTRVRPPTGDAPECTEA